MDSLDQEMTAERLCIVVPCYNEQEVLPESSRKLVGLLRRLMAQGKVAKDSFVLFVNDGSSDATWEIITRLHHDDVLCCGCNLAGNVGHQRALWAGLTVAVRHSDMIVTIDADLQDDVETISAMVDKRREGFDIVYGVRNERKSDTMFKRTTALAFYRLMEAMGTKTVYNHADFRLMSRRAVEHLLDYDERNLFIRGLVPLVGYSTAKVYYDRAERFAGESKYPLSKMLNFAVDGITSFSVKPIRLITYLGVCFLAIALVVFGWIVVSMASGEVVRGWSSIMASIWLCSGCVLTAIGVVGEYIGKIYVESKRRPRFNIERLLMEDNIIEGKKTSNL